MYELVYTHTKIKIAHELCHATHIFCVSPQYQVCSKSKKRYYNSCNPREK